MRKRRCSREYEALDPTAYRSTYADLLPTEPERLALDVGAGSGRDATWLCSLGYEVAAAEPSAGMRAAGQRLHSGAAIRWIDDRLPGLDAVHGLGLSFDVVLLSAVWQHVAPSDRPRAFRNLATLLKTGALLVITLRHGPAPPDRPIHEVSVGEIEALAHTGYHDSWITQKEAAQPRRQRPMIRHSEPPRSFSISDIRLYSADRSS